MALESAFSQVPLWFWGWGSWIVLGCTCLCPLTDLIEHNLSSSHQNAYFLWSSVYLFFFSFGCLWLWWHSYENIFNFRLWIITPMLSSKSFMFLVLIFRLSINSKLIFVYGVKQWPKFILLHMVIQLSQHYVLKTYIFLFHWMFFVPLLKISWLLDFISGFSILFYCLSLCQYYTIWLQ